MGVQDVMVAAKREFIDVQLGAFGVQYARVHIIVTNKPPQLVPLLFYDLCAYAVQPDRPQIWNQPLVLAVIARPVPVTV